MEDIQQEELVVLVDETNNIKGYMPKLEAHEKGLLHRAISIIIYNSKGEMLVQQRAHTKYHWAGIWSNTCCSHPRKDETFQAAADRRLYEELGFSTPLKELFHFIYKATDHSSGLTEHEFDTVFSGIYDGEINFNKDEINAIRWMKPDELLLDLTENDTAYSFWFKIIVEEMIKRSLY